MFDLMHEMRTRIVTSPAFNGDRILGAILFEQTMDRDVERQAHGAVPVGATSTSSRSSRSTRAWPTESDGVQLMKPMHEARRAARGRRPRGRVRHEDALGHQGGEPGRHRAPSLDQQFEYAARILDAGLVPIVEPEVDITSADKAEAEEMLKAGILDRLDADAGRAGR